MEPVERELIMRGIREDAEFVGSYLSAQLRPANQSFAPIIAFSMGNFLSLFVYEGDRKIRSIDTALAQELSPYARTVIERSRHSLKFFEDTKRGLDGVRDAFAREIAPSHREYYAGLVRFRSLAFLSKDLGVYRYRGRVLSTTHSATFTLGLEADAITRPDLGALVREASMEYGRYFSRLGARMDAAQRSFPDTVDASAFPRNVEDWRSERLYRRCFNGPRTPDLNAALTLLLGHLNFIVDVLGSDGPAETPHYTVFKIRFLTIYQVLRSLATLSAEPASGLDAPSRAIVDAILRFPASRRILRDDLRPLRNSLIHYGVDSRLDRTKIESERLLPSLLETALAEDVESFLADLDSCAMLAARSMNDWFENATQK